MIWGGFANPSAFWNIWKLLICIVFYNMFVLCANWSCCGPKCAKMRFCCFLQCERHRFFELWAPICVASGLSFSQSVVFYNELLVAVSQNPLFFKFFLCHTCQGAFGAQMGTKSDAKMIGWGTMSKRRKGRIAMGDSIMGNSIMGIAFWG